MPNTLAHIGAQLPIGKAIRRNWDPRWIVLGLLLPDLPWILQRVALAVLPTLSPISIRAYVVVLSTPVFCTVLAAAIACCFEKGRTIFWILFSQSIIHLLLDAFQQKGGVGIPFLAPFSWHTYSFPAYSMNGWVTNLLTLSGLVILLLLLAGRIHFPKLNRLLIDKPLNLLLSLGLVAIYFSGPLLLHNGVMDANVHDLKLWKGDMPRVGETVHFDRARYVPGDPGTIQDDFNPVPIPIIGVDFPHKTKISTEAVFINEDTLWTATYVVHPKGLRFSYTIVGLLGILLFWTYPLFGSRLQSLFERRFSRQGPNTTR